MPPIHLIHWGNPSNEEPETKHIVETWKDEGAKFGRKTTVESDSNVEAAHSALRSACEDAEAQIIYFTCHGNKDGFCFAEDGRPFIAYTTFATWLAEMKPRVLPGADPEPIRSLVLGSCEAMSLDVKIEQYMPPWVAEVIGFRGCPSPSDVIDLMAGLTSNFSEWGNTISDAVRKAAEEASGQGIDAQFEKMKEAFGAADAAFVYNPTRNIDIAKVQNVTTARREPDTWQWKRDR